MQNVYHIIIGFDILAPPSILFFLNICSRLSFSGFPLLHSQHSLSHRPLQGKGECVWSVWERKKDKREKERKSQICLFQKQMNGELNILHLTNEPCSELWPHDKTHHTISPLQPV